ncbi:dehydrogenase/reductase SDR family member on chromosome X [Amazona aestiva]|uniref:Dehydrogenase/reductase SDR family member on chromosome X n=1 Tax=Amazona aestiva TaxID=12930 RepID=A0A0Q3XAI9_AMAAE|nr:dehydrogenase/reductase SDR family member on chromosome X [Amazona aestiva]
MSDSGPLVQKATASETDTEDGVLCGLINKYDIEIEEIILIKPAGNSESEGQEAVRKIQEETSSGKVEFLYCDLASMKSIRQFVQRFRAKNCPLHVLVNNAGVMLVPERKTEDGFEEHFGLNYLGHFLLTNLLLDKLRQSGTHSHNARIITVSSATHYVGKLHLSDLQSRLAGPDLAGSQQNNMESFTHSGEMVLYSVLEKVLVAAD